MESWILFGADGTRSDETYNANFDIYEKTGDITIESYRPADVGTEYSQSNYLKL